MFSKMLPLFGETAKEFVQDRFLTTMLIGALGGTGMVWANEKVFLSIANPRKKDSKSQMNDRRKGKKKAKSPRIGVDAKFIERLRYIFRIVIPSVKSREMLIIISQTFILVARSLLSIRMAHLMANGLDAVISRSWHKYHRCFTDFFVTGVCASVVNAALKFLRNLLSMYVRERLTKHVHDKYLQDRNFYKAVLSQDHKSLDNADQRIVQDLNDFADTAADLYQRTFKPLLDVILCTRAMGSVLGFKGPMILYSYFFISAAGLSALVPSFGKMIAEEKTREGDFRRSHGRLIAHAEEVAFLGGGDREKSILNEELDQIVNYKRHTEILRFKQGIIDQWFIKYMASCIGFPVLALPFMWRKHLGDAAKIAGDYRYSDNLIRNASSAIGDLMMVYKKVQKLAGFTARVSELLEAVENEELENKTDGVTVIGDTVDFNKVTVYTPDNRLLLKELTVSLPQGQNVIVVGPNGAGKTSLFRVLAGLWKLHSGVLTRPLGIESEVFYVPQNPYLVSGSLRDQVIYPLDEVQARKKVMNMDKDIEDCLERVGLKKLLLPNLGLDRRHHDWSDVLSGGEKQRIGIARLFFHKPKFAILDESTSAVNVDEEGPMYEYAVELGITFFSIAHRLALRRFHHLELHIIGDGSGAYATKFIDQDKEWSDYNKKHNHDKKK